MSEYSGLVEDMGGDLWESVQCMAGDGMSDQ